MTTFTATAAVDGLLAAFAAGTAPAGDLFAADVVLDATVPNWRFRLRGADRVRAQYAGWFDTPGRYDELRRHRTETGEVVEYAISAVDADGPYTAHHVHVLDIDAAGRITADRFWCGGRWYAGRLAEMAEAQRRLDQARA